MANEFLDVGTDPFSQIGSWLKDAYNGRFNIKGGGPIEETPLERQARLTRERLRAEGAPRAGGVPNAPALASAEPSTGGATGGWDAPAPKGPQVPLPMASANAAPIPVAAPPAASGGGRNGYPAPTAASGRLQALQTMQTMRAQERDPNAMRDIDTEIGRLNAMTDAQYEAEATAGAGGPNGKFGFGAGGNAGAGAGTVTRNGAVVQDRLRGGTPTAMTTGGPGAGVTPTINGGATPPSAIPWQERRDAMTRELEKLQAEPDYTALIAEGKRRGGEGMNNLMLAMAAQQAGKEHEPMAGAFLKRALALQDPLKFSGGQVDENGNVVNDPGYKREQAMKNWTERMGQIDKGQGAEQTAAMNYLLGMNRIQSTEGMAADRFAANGGPGAGRQISDAGVKDIAGFETSKAQLDALLTSFKPEYARNVAGFGAIENWTGDMMGTPAGMWWKQVMANQNQVLKDLSGSAVTAPEAARFQAAFLNPNMPAETIPLQLRRQAEAAQAARDKLIQVYGQSGRNVSGFAPGAQPQQGAAPAAAPPPVAGGTVKWGQLK